MLNAEPKSQSSHAWRSILQGNKLLTNNIKWNIGNGQNISIWHDNWLPSKPPRLAKPNGNLNYRPKLVKDLLIPGTFTWNESLVRQYIHQEDRSLLYLLRPSLTGFQDNISWIHTKDGNYYVKSGYYVQRHQSIIGNMHNENTNSHNLFQDIWKFNVMPKVKHFWWKSLHNALPVADNLKKRNLRVDNSCKMCGEYPETVNHLLFQCQLSKEIWDLSPILTPPGEFYTSHSLSKNICMILNLNKHQGDAINLFTIIGWQLWKMRNAMVFENCKWPIPVVINKALVTLSMWNQEISLDKDVQGNNENVQRSL